MQPLLSVDYLTNGAVVAGTASGEVYVWKPSEKTVGSTWQAHMSTVMALHATQGNTLWTAGKDGKVREWDATFKQLRQIDLRQVAATTLDRFGRSVLNTQGHLPLAKTLSFLNGHLLVGTSSHELLDITVADGSALLVTAGHKQGEIWGLAMHPNAALFATCSEDSSLRVVDIKSHAIVSFRNLPKPASCCGYSPDGLHIAIGFIDGSWADVKADTLQDVHTYKNRKERVSVVKFSPDGRMLAVGTHDNFVDLFDTTRGFRMLSTLVGNSSFITHLDWSSSSEYLRTNDGAYELLFWRARTGKQVKTPQKLRDIEWNSCTCILGWDVAGIWPKCADGTDVNSVDRNKLGDLLLVGDDFGNVGLQRYPASKPGGQVIHFGAHSSHVTMARFSFDDHYVISIGGGDNTICQWHLHGVNEVGDEAADPVEIEFDSTRSFMPTSAVVQQEVMVQEASSLYESSPTSAMAGGAPPAERPAPSLPSGWFSAVRPWLGAVFPPSSLPVISGDQPEATLQLEHVYGFCGKEGRENIAFLASGEIVFPAAGLGIVMDASKRQRFFTGHTDDVVSLALHPDGKTVATGQVGRDPFIMVWDATNLKLLKVLKGFHQRAVTSLSFSPDGKLLASVGMDNNHTIAVWDWQAGVVVGQVRASTDLVSDVNFSPFKPGLVVSCGIKHFAFWQFDEASKQLKPVKGLTLHGVKLQTCNCMAFPAPGVVILGTEGGSIYVFNDSGAFIQEIADAHPKASARSHGVTALHASKEGIISGGSGGKLRLWKLDDKQQLVSTGEISLQTDQSIDSTFKPRAIARNGNRVVVGTLRGEILLVDFDAKRVVDILVQGLSKGEVWGLAAHPTNSAIIATGCEDMSVRVWDVKQRKQLCVKNMAHAVMSADFNADGTLLAVGFNDGGFAVLKADDLSQVFSAADRKECISVIRFSPDGQRIAVGSHDNFVDIYSIADSGHKQLGTCSGHASFVTHLDWSRDGKYLQTNCGAYELLFWDTATCSQITQASKLRDVVWASFTCVLGWPVQGIWPAGSQGNDINAVARSHSGDLLVTADDYGGVKLFRYPAVLPQSKFRRFTGHSAHVTNVVFEADDSHVLTTGGGDRCIFEWRLSKK